ncbi:hypothetical protein [Alloprevotella tannerae]|uniref:hypothetical protein n=1 Tax=Alloprevotella tannerae TaxID=76122 RepID=UPI00362346D3
MKWAVFTYFHELLFIVRSLADAFERPTLRGCQILGTLDRVKALRPLTLPYQKANPDGVICGGIGWRWDVRVKVNAIGVINSASVDHLMS